MGDVDDELDPQHGQGADELEPGSEVDETDVQGDLRQHDQYLAGLIQNGEAAGYARQTQTLRTIRKMLGKSKKLIAEAEDRGRQRALKEFEAGNGEAVAAIKQQVQQELAAETSRARSLDRLGVPEPLRPMFDNVDVAGGFQAFQKQADLLRASGIEWRQDPEAQQLAATRVRVWQEQAATAEQNGQADMSPGPMPDQVREDLIRRSVSQMAAAAAGGTQVGATTLEQEIRQAAQNPAGADPMDLAARLNRELEATSAQLAGRSLLNPGEW